MSTRLRQVKPRIPGHSADRPRAIDDPGPLPVRLLTVQDRTANPTMVFPDHAARLGRSGPARRTSAGKTVRPPIAHGESPRLIRPCAPPATRARCPAALPTRVRVGRSPGGTRRAPTLEPGFTPVVPFSRQVGRPGRTTLDFVALRYAAGTGEVSTAAIGAYRQQT